jgi:DNA invertase Pin-like site-specific DNA recombinase
MSVFIYARVSHRSSADSGISIDDQIARGHRYASDIIPDVPQSIHSFGSSLPGVFCDEAVSGWNKPFSMRPAGLCLSRVIQPGDHIIFYSVDRAARNMRDFCNMAWDFDRKGVHVHFLSEQINSATAIGKFQLHMRGAAAQFFSDLISERTREALAIRRMNAGLKPLPGKKHTKWVANSDLAAWNTIQAAAPGRPIGTIYRYERVSTDRQYTSGLGLQHQSRATLQAANRLREELGSTIFDTPFSDPAISAFSKKFHERQAGKALLDIVQPGDDIVIYRLDRAWRNPGDAIEMVEQLFERNIYVHLINEGIRTDTRQGVEWIGVLAAMAHMESSMRSTRVKQALASCKSRGRPYSGQMPLGWRGKEIKPGVKKMVLDVPEIANRAVVYVMKHEFGMREVDIDAAMLAIKCMKNKATATLAMMTKRRVWETLKKCEEFRDSLSPHLWEDVLSSAREKLNIPIPRRHWYRPKWEGDEISIAQLSCSTRYETSQ